VRSVDLDNSKWVSGYSIIHNPELNINHHNTLATLTASGYLSVKEFNGSKYYNIDDVRRYTQLIEDLNENYLSPTQIAESIGYNSRVKAEMLEIIKGFCRNEEIKFKELDYPIRKDGRGSREERLFVYKPDYLNFRERYLTCQEVFNMFDHISPSRLAYLTNLKKVVQKVVIWPNIPLYSKEQLEKFNPSPVDLNPEEHYTLEEVCTILSFDSDKTWRKYRDDNGIPYFTKTLSKEQFYRKNQIDDLRKKQIEYTTKYYSPSQVLIDISMYNANYHKITRINADQLMRAAFSDSKMQIAFPKKEMDEFIEEMSSRKQLSQIDYGVPLVDAFERYMQAEGMSYEANSVTTTKWFEYCHKKLQLTDKCPNIKTRARRVFYFSICTDILFKFLRNKELFDISTNEINLGLFSIKGTTQRKILYNFCTEFYDDLIRDGENISFNLRRLNSPYAENSENKREKEIYQFDEYQSVLDYATDMKIHKSKAIEDALNKIAKKNTSHYASAWLYVLISLNNAWRHPDIVYNLTMLNLGRLGIHSLEDLRNRDLTSQEAELIIRQIMAKDKSHTKTNAVARFFCSSVVTVPLATSAIICTLISRELNLGDEIVHFGNIYNDFSKLASNVFFAELEGGFEFKIQKMNRSLLTLIYQLLVDKGYGGAALELAQRLRSHFDYESTNIYIQIPQDKLDELTEQLFNRRHFGYIHHTFLDVLYGPEESRSARTKDIATLDGIFRVYEIEATVGFMMKVQRDKQTVMEMIMRMSLDEVREYLFKISANLLPSKEEHVQCLVSETGCLHPETRTCHGCAYAIPNFYAISTMTNSFTELLQNFGNAFKSTDGKAYDKTQKTKLVNILFKEIDLLREACDMFGEKEVLSFFEGGEQGYYELLKSVNQVAATDIESYLPYRIGGE